MCPKCGKGSGRGGPWELLFLVYRRAALTHNKSKTYFIFWNISFLSQLLLVNKIFQMTATLYEYRIRKLLHTGYRMGRHGCSRIRVPSHVSGMRCVFARNHESERDALMLLSLSLTWFCAKTQRIPDRWDGTFSRVG